MDSATQGSLFHKNDLIATTPIEEESLIGNGKKLK
jgi:hypothetical protein